MKEKHWEITVKISLGMQVDLLAPVMIFLQRFCAAEILHIRSFDKEPDAVSKAENAAAAAS